MKYKIDIQGMHCTGCIALLTILFEERGFTDVTINIANNSGFFASEDSEANVRGLLNSVFAEASKYAYSNLQAIK